MMDIIRLRRPRPYAGQPKPASPKPASPKPASDDDYRPRAQLSHRCPVRPALPPIPAYRGYSRDLGGVKVRAPGDDLTSDLIAIHDEDPERLRLDEISSILFSLSFAGHETTTGLIGNTVRRLLEDPSRWAEIAKQPELIPAAAGRDAAAFDRPDQFDMHRADAGRHLAFGQGLHFCLGANLGKLEAQIAVPQLARRYPDLQLAPDQQFTFHPNISFRGPQVLTVRRG